MEILQAKITILNEKIRAVDFSGLIANIKKHLFNFFEQIKCIGDAGLLDDYERRKLRVFNLLNFFQLVSGILVPLIGLMQNSILPVKIWLLACLPTLISIGVLVFNHYRKYQAA